MNIANFLHDDPAAESHVGFGRYLYEGKLIILGNPRMRRFIRLLNADDDLNQQFVEQAEDLGLDHRDDNVKCDYLLSQTRSIKAIYLMAIYTHMYEEGIEPFIFDNDDIFFYILGCVGTVFQRQYTNKLLSEIVDLLIDTENQE